jgi:hypothetical protein
VSRDFLRSFSSEILRSASGSPRRSRPLSSNRSNAQTQRCCFFPLRKWSARKSGRPRSSVAVSSPSMIAERTGSAATVAAMVGRRRVVVAVFGVEGDVSTGLWSWLRQPSNFISWSHASPVGGRRSDDESFLFRNWLRRHYSTRQHQWHAVACQCIVPYRFSGCVAAAVSYTPSVVCTRG